jgi:hypothetical protein
MVALDSRVAFNSFPRLSAHLPFLLLLLNPAFHDFPLFAPFPRPLLTLLLLPRDDPSPKITTRTTDAAGRRP